MMKWFTLRTSRGARGRALLGAYLLAALIWPAIGPMPWLVDFTPEDRAHAATVADAHENRLAHHDASEIPGSPTHPDDHNCFQCEVIKHLARCVPSEGSYPTVALVTSRPPQPSIQVRSNYTAFALPRPPIRGPPPLNG